MRHRHAAFTLVVAAASAFLSGCDGKPHGRFPAAQAGQVERGRLLLSQYQCGSCHAIPDVPASRGTIGAPLEGFGKRSYIAGHIPNRPELLARWITEPSALVPGTPMPSMGVSPRDAQDMAAFLMSLQ